MQCSWFWFEIYSFNNKTFSQKKRNDCTQCVPRAIIYQSHDGIITRQEKEKDYWNENQIEKMLKTHRLIIMHSLWAFSHRLSIKSLSLRKLLLPFPSSPIQLFYFIFSYRLQRLAWLLDVWRSHSDGIQMSFGKFAVPNPIDLKSVLFVEYDGPIH